MGIYFLEHEKCKILAQLKFFSQFECLIVLQMNVNKIIQIKNILAKLHT